LTDLVGAWASTSRRRVALTISAGAPGKPIVVEACAARGSVVSPARGSKGGVVEYVFGLIIIALFMGWLLIGVDVMQTVKEGDRQSAGQDDEGSVSNLVSHLQGRRLA
jgi:hypothetical protein